MHVMYLPISVTRSSNADVKKWNFLSAKYSIYILFYTSFSTNGRIKLTISPFICFWSIFPNIFHSPPWDLPCSHPTLLVYHHTLFPVTRPDRTVHRQHWCLDKILTTLVSPTSASGTLQSSWDSGSESLSSPWSSELSHRKPLKHSSKKR